MLHSELRKFTMVSQPSCENVLVRSNIVLKLRLVILSKSVNLRHLQYILIILSYIYWFEQFLDCRGLQNCCMSSSRQSHDIRQLTFNFWSYTSGVFVGVTRNHKQRIRVRQPDIPQALSQYAIILFLQKTT